MLLSARTGGRPARHQARYALRLCQPRPASLGDRARQPRAPLSSGRRRSAARSPLRRSAPRAADSEALVPVIASSICLIEERPLLLPGDGMRAASPNGPALEEVAVLLWRAEREPMLPMTSAGAVAGRRNSGLRAHRDLPDPAGGAGGQGPAGARPDPERGDPHRLADRPPARGLRRPGAIILRADPSPARRGLALG